MKRWLKRLGISLAVLLALAGGYYVLNYNIARYNFAVVEEGKIYRSGQPDEALLEKMVEKYKIKTIVSLRGGPPQFEKDFAAAHGLQVFSFRMSARTEPSDEDIAKCLELINNPANQPVLVHCRGGADRTGLVLAIERVLNGGWSMEAAEKEMSFHRNLPFFTPMPRRKFREYVQNHGIWDKKFESNVHSVPSLGAAADKEIITPEYQIPLGGFSPKRLSLGVHDDLYARCLIIESAYGGNRIAFVSLDFVGFLRYDVLLVREEIRKKGLMDPDCLFIYSTHQHSGPDTIGMWSRSAFPFAPNLAGSGRDEEYLAGVRKKIVELVDRTIRKLTPADLSIIETSGEGYSKNIHLPKEISGSPDSGELDVSLVTLVVKASAGSVQNGKTIATLTNFGVHPETFRPSNQLISADFPGVLVKRMEEEFGGTALFANGLLGAMVSCRTDLAQEFPSGEARANGVGTGLTKRVVDAKAGMKKIDFQDCGLRVRKMLVKIPLDNFLFQEGMKLGIIPHNASILTENREVITEVAIVDLGNIRILMVPGEMQPRLGLKIKEMTGAKMIFGLANDEIGYIIATEDFYKIEEDPEKGRKYLYEYEQTMSLGPETGRLIYEAFEKLMKK